MRSTEINHYIITRFNMPWVKEDSDVPRGLNPDYLRKRFELFEEYTVPSMKNQTCKNFKWLVFYDKRTPDEFKEKIESYNSLGFYKPVYVEPGFSLKDYIDSLIKKEGGSFVSSRVDNDDAIMPDYVESVQKKAIEVFPRDMYLTSIKNLRYDVNDRTITKYRLKKNHFISRTGNVFEVNQNSMPSNPMLYARVKGIHSVEIVHETNLLNNTIYTYNGIIDSKSYRYLKGCLGYELLEDFEYKRFCLNRSKEDVPLVFEKCKNRLKKMIKKHILKEKR